MGYIVKLPPVSASENLQRLSFPRKTGYTGDTGNSLFFQPPPGLDDPYWTEAEGAWAHICRHPYLPEAMRWLKQISPYLHGQLTDVLPCEISQLWEVLAPLDQFQAVLARWVTANQDACLFYLAQSGRESAGGRSRNESEATAPHCRQGAFKVSVSEQRNGPAMKAT